jgi:vitamin B12 transporter
MSLPLLFIFFSSAALAQTALDPIEVEATKDIERFTFTNSSTITSQALEREPFGLVSTAIEKVSGVIANQNGGPGGRVSFFIRGTESRHVSFTLDGLKINDTSNTDRQFDAAFMSSPFIKEVVVHKGPQAVLYGSDAIGGMIEMKSRKGEDAPQTRLSINGGSFGTIEASLSKDWKSTSKSNGTLTATQFHSDGISRLNKKRFNAKERDATDITQLTSSSEHRWANKYQTDFLASYLHAVAEQDGFNSDNGNDFSRNDQYIVQQKTHHEIDSRQSISLRTGFNRHQRHNESLSMNEEFFNGNLFQNEIIHRLELGKVGLLSGLASDHESSKAIGMEKSFDQSSAFLQSAMAFDKWRFHAGARVDKHSKYGSFLTGSTGVAYEGFSLQYSQGYKAPSLYQLYGPSSFGAPVGNPNLVPETNHYLEASWKKVSETFESGISLFQNRLSNQFTYSFTQGYLNQQRYIAEGVEVNAILKRKTFHFSGSLTHQNFREEQSAILRRPYNMILAAVSYFPEETIELNVTERWYSSRKDFGTTGITKLNGYEVTDISIRKTWAQDDVALQLKNILNREYEEIYGFNVMPRSIFAHYGHQF